MSKNKTLELISSLSVYDQKQFRNYLASPFFSCDPLEIQLFEMLLKGIKKQEFGKEEIYRLLVPGKKFDDKHFRYVASGLNKNLIHFFSLRYLEKDVILKESIASKVLASRDCEKAYFMHHKETTSKGIFENATGYFHKYENAETHLTYTGLKLNRKSTPDYSDTLFNLDAFYLVKKLQLSCEVANLTNVLKTTHEIELAEALKQLAVKNPFKHLPSVKIYFQILEMLTKSNAASHFVSVEQLLIQYADTFHPKELNEMYQYLKNFCVKKVNQGDLNYLRTLFTIYCSMLDNKRLMNYDFLSQWEYKNIVSISLRLNEKDWCGKFILKYINYLKPEDRENALAYNLAYFFLIDKEYRKAIRKLQEVELNDIFYQLDARVILLKCYYELDDTDSFFYQASSFRLFLLRNRHISDYQKNIYRNLIKFLTAIVRAGYSEIKLKKISVELEKEKNVADLNWLRAKINEAIAM